LTLHDANNRVAYVLLTGLSSKTATVRIGGVSQTVSLVSLTEMWRGDFWTFWRAPPGYLSRSTDAEASAWIATQLASIERTTQSGARTTDTESTAAAPSDTALKSKIHAFQLAHGLNPDGRAGPITLMQLNRAAGVDEPRLQTD
jgi:general secretion pathway protein A